MRFQNNFALVTLIVFILVSGCVSTAPRLDNNRDTTQQQTQADTQNSQTDNKLNLKPQAEPATATTPEISQLKNQRNLEKLNEQISSRAVANGAAESESLDRFSYPLGPGDVIDISVFQVEELNRKSRISGDGYIMMPLIGGIFAEGLTTTQLEDELEKKLNEQYMQNPQVSVFIDEFRSHQVSVTGAVNQPNIYEIQRPQTVLDMLALAGGLSDEAGPQIYIKRIVTDVDTGNRKRESTVIKLDTLLTSVDPRVNVVLKAGDSVNVPKAGVVFVEGAVNSPGAYQIKGDMNILKAIAVAGDIKFEARRGDVQVFREVNGSTQIIPVDLDAIKSQKIKDIALLDGDIIVVPDSQFKRGWSGFWKGITGIFSVGTRI